MIRLTKGQLGGSPSWVSHQALWGISTEERLAGLAGDGVEVEPQSFVSTNSACFVLTAALRPSFEAYTGLSSTRGKATSGVTRGMEPVGRRGRQGRGVEVISEEKTVTVEGQVKATLRPAKVIVSTTAIEVGSVARQRDN